MYIYIICLSFNELHTMIYIYIYIYISIHIYIYLYISIYVSTSPISNVFVKGGKYQLLMCHIAT